MDHLSAMNVDAWSPSPDSAIDADEEDDVFKALADPSRRLLLDSLFDEDGQTLGELSARLPEMTRFGVMKHLRILDAAGLVTSRKVGRERLHYLNPVPIRLIHDRWIGKYAEPWVGALANLKVRFDETPMDAAADPGLTKPRHVFQVYIRTTPDRLWQAIVDPAFTQRYFRRSRVDSTWEPGARMRYFIDEDLVVDGKVLDADPPRRLVTTWSFRRSPELRDDPPSRVTWEIEPVGDTCRLTLVHDDFPSETATFRSVVSGWPLVLSSLKSLLETGEGLAIPATGK
jgi:uncharacterized protein YndB with AHSA1/START domain/DNA-binding transcriptional ArsR family regulator